MEQHLFEAEFAWDAWEDALLSPVDTPGAVVRHEEERSPWTCRPARLPPAAR
jgi:hypothetical protein